MIKINNQRQKERRMGFNIVSNLVRTFDFKLPPFIFVILLLNNTITNAGSDHRLIIQESEKQEFSCSVKFDEDMARFIFHDISLKYEGIPVFSDEEIYAPAMFVYFENNKFPKIQDDFKQYDIGVHYYLSSEQVRLNDNGKLVIKESIKKLRLKDLLLFKSSGNTYDKQYSYPFEISNKSMSKYIEGDDVVFDVYKTQQTHFLFRGKDKPKEAFFWIFWGLDKPLKCRALIK